MYCKAAQRILLHKYCFLKQFPFDLRLINAFLESDVSNFPSQISKISAHILVFFFYSSIVESTITIVDFFKTPIVEIYSTIEEKKTMVGTMDFKHFDSLRVFPVEFGLTSPLFSSGS